MICSRPGIGSPALHLKSYLKDSRVPTLQSHSHLKRQQMCASTQHPQGVPSLGNSTSARRCYCCWLKPTNPFVLASFPWFLCSGEPLSQVTRAPHHPQYHEPTAENLDLSPVMSGQFSGQQGNPGTLARHNPDPQPHYQPMPACPLDRKTHTGCLPWGVSRREI